MAKLNLNFYWQWLKRIFDRDNSRLDIKPSRVWLILVMMFFIGLICDVGLIFYFNWKLESIGQASGLANQPIANAKIDSKKMKVIISDYQQRQETFVKLKNQKPTVFDPGL